MFGEESRTVMARALVMCARVHELSQVEIAERLGETRTTIQRVMMANSAISTRAIERVANKCGWSTPEDAARFVARVEAMQWL